MAMTSSPAYAALIEVVEQALSWERLLQEPGPAIDRARASEDLGAVTPAVRAVIEELHGKA